MTAPAPPAPFFKRTGSDDFPSLLKALISGQPKSGKGLASGTPVQTPKGWRNIEDLAIGDEVQGRDGPTLVTGVFPQGVRTLFLVALDDGSSVTCDDQHLWTVQPHGYSARTVDVHTLMTKVVTNARYGYLPVVAPIQGIEQILPIPAYQLGLLIGDGGLTSGVKFHKPDKQLHEALRAHYDTGSWDDYTGALCIHGLNQTIRNLGLNGTSLEKHIPEAYLTSTIDDRFALLQGLLDTDGGMNGNSTCFYTSAPRLRDDVVALVRALGGVAVVRTKAEPKYTYMGALRIGAAAYNISIRLPVQFGCPFRLERKVDAWRNGKVKRPPSRRVVSVTPAGTGESTCISVAATDGLFVTQDYIVTHNSTILGSVPNIVIADTEPFANNLQSIAHRNVPYITVTSTGDLQRLLVVLRDETMRAKAAADLGIPAIQAVGIDTLDSLQQIMKKERMRETRQSQFLRDDWGWLKEEMVTLLRAFTSLPLHVLFAVHTKSVEIGKGDDARTIILPGLQGAIAEEVAGLVGYSLLTFRKQAVRPDGSTYTKYWLRAEGDETYGFLGNRAAGRLPDIIEPSFQAIFDAATAGRALVKPPPAPLNIQSTAPTTAVSNGAASANGAVAPSPEILPQSLGQDSPVATAEAEPVPAGRYATVDGQPAAAPPGDDELLNAAGLTFVKKVYDANGLEFPEDLIRALNMGQARTLVRFWQAVQQDEVEGKLDKSASDEVTLYLDAQGWLAGADMARIHPAETEGGTAQVAPPQEQSAVVADISGTIPQVMAYIGDSLADAQEVYDLEMRRDKPRATLVNALTNMGVTVQTPVRTPLVIVPAETAPVAATPEPAPEPVAPAEVTPEPAVVEVPMVEDHVVQAALAHVEEVLGAVPIDENGTPLPCEECGGPVDDEDIATLGMSRYSRRLCIGDYLSEAKKAKA